jgi:hypothetical protein
MMMRFSRTRLWLFLAVAACGGGDPAGPTLTTLSVAVSPTSVEVGQSATATASGVDQNGQPIAVGSVTWTSSNTTVATVNASGAVSALSPGTVQISAAATGKTAQATLTVIAASAPCTGTTLRPDIGDVRTLSPAEAASLCIGASGNATEYVLIAFNNSNVGSTTTPFQITSTNTISVTATPNVGFLDATSFARAMEQTSMEAEILERARIDIGAVANRPRVTRTRANTSRIPDAPTEGSIVSINANLSGNLCTAARNDHPARLVALRPHAMFFVDTLAPMGGYTDAEIIEFANAFEANVYPIDEAAFGTVADVDENGRIAIFFTHGLNVLTTSTTGGFIGGLFAPRDLFSASVTGGCIGSNEAEMFYIPVPDTGKVVNGNYTDRAFLKQLVPSTLAHEYQHLINASRRLYVHGAQSFEQTWLNEGLSHIAEELYFYRVSSTAARLNIDVDVLRASPNTALPAFNAHAIQNFARLFSYLATPSTISPFEGNTLESRGAIWQLLRYAADRKGGNENDIWQALVNTTTIGQPNFNRVFGNIIEQTRDWAVAQFVDDLVTVVPRYTNPSWNFRSILAALATSRRFPIATSQLIGGIPLPLSAVGGGAAYVRFRVAANTPASLAASASGVPLPANIDLILVRTQ